MHLAHKGRGAGSAATVATGGVIRPMLALLRVFPVSAIVFMKDFVKRSIARGVSKLSFHKE